MRNSLKFQNFLSSRPARHQSVLLRSPDAIDAFVMIAAAGIRFEAKVTESSKQELLVLTKKPLPALPKGQRVDVEFHRGVTGKTPPISGIVHWVYDQPEETQCGILLSSPVPNEYHTAHPWCLRNSIRYKSRISGQVYFPDTGTSSPGTVLNYSRDGVCIQLPFAPTSGTGFQFAWEGACPLPIEGVIRWVTVQPDGVLCGCELKGCDGLLLSGITF